MSTNRSPMTSRYTRKENYESINMASSFQNLSPHRAYNTHASQEHSALKKSMQQKQIEDLEHKVDLILQHNDKLVMENELLKKKLDSVHEHNDKLILENEMVKKRLAELQFYGQSEIQKERMSRYKMAEDGELYLQKVNAEIMIKTREYEGSVRSFENYKEHSRKEIETLNELIGQLNLNTDTIKSQNAKLTQ